MSEQLICPRCATPNAPTATSCYYCGWEPSVQQQGGNAAGPAGPGTPATSYPQGPQSAPNPAGGPGNGTGPHGFGDAAHGPTFAGGYANGGYGADDAAAYGGYGTGAYGAGYGADGGYRPGADNPAGPAASGGPGYTQVRGNAGGPPPYGVAAGAGQGDVPDRNKLLMIIAGAVGAAVLIALAVFVIIRFVVPGNGESTNPVPGPTSSSGPSQPTASTQAPSPTAASSPAAPPIPNYDKIASAVKSGVLKVYATACGSDGSRIGSAFLIDDDTAVASYASLAGAQVVVVSTGSDLVSAQITAADPDHGIVILKLDRSVDGHVFDIDTSTAKIGDPVGLLGIGAKSSTVKVRTSKITGDSLTARVGDIKITGLGGTSLDADDGWAGAPTLNADGAANGMVIAGPGAAQAMVVPGKAIRRAVSQGGDVPDGTCNDPHGPELTTIGGNPTTAVKKTLLAYFGGINNGDYRTAYRQLGPHSNSGPFSGYVNGWRSAYDFNIDVKSVSGSGDGTHAEVSFNSITLPGQGPKGHAEATCARWEMNYTFAADGNRLLIDRVTATPSLC